jgi:hypothetical protein
VANTLLYRVVKGNLRRIMNIENLFICQKKTAQGVTAARGDTHKVRLLEQGDLETGYCIVG